jgi:hypothetical protein
MDLLVQQRNKKLLVEEDGLGVGEDEIIKRQAWRRCNFLERTMKPSERPLERKMDLLIESREKAGRSRWNPL